MNTLNTKIENAIYALSFKITDLSGHAEFETQPDGSEVTFIGQDSTDFTRDEYDRLCQGTAFIEELALTKLYGFAEACYEQNDAEDLINNVGSIDKQSQSDWNLTDEEYHLAILTAIAHHIHN